MSRHICLVPNEWNHYYGSSTIEVVLKKEITCDQIRQKIGGAEINLNSVSARLHYWGDQPWMKKLSDKKTWPHPHEYFGVYMSCNTCRALNKPKMLGIDR